MERIRSLLLIMILVVIGVVAVLWQIGAMDSVLAGMATAIFGGIVAVIAIPEIWDRFRPSAKIERPSAPDEQRYLRGLISRFNKEEKLFVELAGKTPIRSRFDSYDDIFMLDGSNEPLKSYNDIAQAVSDYIQFVLIGDPGAGKTTNMRRLAADLAEARLYPDRPRPDWLTVLYSSDQCVPLPLWIDLGSSDNPPIAADLLDYWWDYHALPGNVEEAIHTLDVWLLLDGLNEMPEGRVSRQDRVESIKALLKHYPDVRAIVTCRVNDYSAAQYNETDSKESDQSVRIEARVNTAKGKLNLGQPIVCVQKLDDERVVTFVSGRLEGDLAAAGLLEQLASTEGMLQMASNPYTLVMLIDIYRAKHQLPTDLNSLYTMYTKIRYQDYFKRGLTNLSWETLRYGLQQLAFHMIVKRKGTVAEIDWAKKRIGWTALQDGLNLGMLLGDDQSVRFYHQSLQWYFALPALTVALKKRWYEPVIQPRENFIRSISDLGEIAAPAVTDLIAVLNDDDEWIRSVAIDALGKIRAQEAVPILIDLLKANNISAPFALAKMGVQEAVPALLEVLKHGDIHVRLNAISALGEIGAPETIPSLIAELKGEYWFHRLNAVAALGKYNVPEVKPALRAALDDEEDLVRVTAARVLFKMGETESLPVLLTTLGNGRPSVRSSAARVLDELCPPEAVPFLIAALKDDDKFVRLNAASALGKIGGVPEAIPVLIAALKDDDKFVRLNAASALGKIGMSEGVPTLIAMLKPSIFSVFRDQRKNQELRVSAVEKLTEIGTQEAISAIIATLNDNDGQVRSSAVDALRRLSTPEAQKALQQVGLI